MRRKAWDLERDIGPFLNYRFHQNMVEMAATRRLWSLPLPRVAATADSPANALD